VIFWHEKCERKQINLVTKTKTFHTLRVPSKIVKNTSIFSIKKKQANLLLHNFSQILIGNLLN